MKLLIYSHFFAPSIGGVETAALLLSERLTELRHANGGREFEITLVTQTPGGDYDDRKVPFRVVRRPGFLHLWRLIGLTLFTSPGQRSRLCHWACCHEGRWSSSIMASRRSARAVICTLAVTLIRWRGF